MKSIKEAGNLSGKRVLIRADWNVPVIDGKISDTSRIETTVKTIEFVLKNEGKVIVMSHLGNGENSLEMVAEEAEKFFPSREIKFIKDPWNSDEERILRGLQNGEIAVLENLRFWEGEKQNSEVFAKNLAELADIFVNEAFSSSHRKHASIIGVPKFIPAYAGFHFLKEFEKLSMAFDPEHPFFLILGGAKFETKLPLVEKFLNIADEIFIGGALAKTASKIPKLYKEASNHKIIFPVGDITAPDANNKTLALLQEKINKAKFILWNGPLGKYENDYKEGTLKLARMLADSTAKVIVGGGDTENVIDELGVSDKFSWISLAGGAMLDFLSNETLPGIDILNETR